METVITPMGSLSKQTFLLTGILLLLFAGTAEWLSRQMFFQAPLTPPKMGSSHYQLGHKWFLLETEVRQRGPVDCIMVGSSMVDVGFDPGAFQDAYRHATGRDIHCFNFGIDAATAASTYALTKILIEDYHPRFLIVGTDPRDYAVPARDRDASVVLNSPWIQYRQGNFSLEGWLLDNSYFYRYRQHLSRLVHFNFEGTLWSETQLKFPIRSNGFTEVTKVNPRVDQPPDPADTSYEVTYYSRLYTNYAILDENLAALKGIMSYNGSRTQVLVIEMPVSDGLYYFFGDPKADYDRYVHRVSELAQHHQVAFWRTEPLDFIPDDVWTDYSHLNVTGAEIFSAWLGTEIGGIDIP